MAFLNELFLKFFIEETLYKKNGYWEPFFVPTSLVKLPKEKKMLGQVFSGKEKLGPCFCRETIQGSWKALEFIEIVHSFHFFIFHP
jgi:hypothetical protein